MKDWQKLSHVKWDCKYHVVFVTKYRKRKIYGEIRQKIGKIIRALCEQKGILLHEGHAMSDHIHILVSIPHLYGLHWQDLSQKDLLQVLLRTQLTSLVSREL